MMKNFLKQTTNFIRTPQGFFLSLSLISGGIFILIIPPFQTPDEAAHFLRAYQVSNGDFIPEKRGNIVGSYLPVSLQETEKAVDSGGALQTHPNQKYRLGNTKYALLNIRLNEGEKKFVDTTVTASYSPVGYVPQSLAIGIGRIFNAPPIVILYLVRLFVLMAWVTMVFIAIRLFPFKKWAVAGIALMPMLVAQSVSVGVDVVAVGSGLLFTSIILSFLYTKNKINRKKLLLVLASAVLMVLSKQVMIVLLMLLLILPKNSIGDTKKAIVLKSLIIILPIVLLVIWTLVSPEADANVTQIQNNQDTGGQVRYLLGQPWAFINVLFHTFFFTWGDSISQSLIGNFGWLDTPLAATFINLGYIALFVYWCVNYEKKQVTPLSKVNKVIFAVVAALYFLAVCGAMYVLFSPVGYSLIVGVQGRYLFPCLFLLIPVLFTKLLTAKEDNFIIFTKVVSISLLIVSVITIIYRYYIHAV